MTRQADAATTSSFEVDNRESRASVPVRATSEEEEEEEEEDDEDEVKRLVYLQP